jgi:ribosome-associated heat shock protein Hsp15
VQINGLHAKPGRDVHAGEMVTVRIGLITKTFKILDVPRARLGAKLLPQHVLDLTPPEEYARAKQAGIEHMLARERGRGRPTKKDRRAMGRLFGFD